MEKLETIIGGGGQAGLAVSRQLQRDGRRIRLQTEGETAFPGLHFAGLPWLRSGLLLGMAEEAALVAGRIGRASWPQASGPSVSAPGFSQGDKKCLPFLVLCNI